MIGNKTFKKEA